MSADLRQAVHPGGAERGRELFRVLLDLIRPKVLIAHGAGTARELGRALNRQLPQTLREPGDPISVQYGEMVVFVIPSLAPPGFNKWSRWAQDHLEAVSRGVARQLTKIEP